MTDNKNSLPCTDCKFKDRCNMRDIVELTHANGLPVACNVKYRESNDKKLGSMMRGC